jgi:histidine triad (HIT) family protein
MKKFLENVILGPGEIKELDKDGCVFCQIISGKLSSNIIWQDDLAIAIDDRNPQAPSHILLIPKEHITDITECKDSLALGKLFQSASMLASKQGLTKGFRLVVNTGSEGGQTVHHLHIHLLGGRNLSWPPG